MSPELPTSNATSQGPSTKNWLLLLSLLTVLLLVGSRIQLPARSVTSPVLTGSPARDARSAALPSGRRVAHKSPAPEPHAAPTTIAAAIAL